METSSTKSVRDSRLASSPSQFYAPRLYRRQLRLYRRAARFIGAHPSLTTAVAIIEVITIAAVVLYN